MRRGISPVKVLAVIAVVIVGTCFVHDIIKADSQHQSGCVKKMVRHDILCHVYCACRIGGISGWQVCWQRQINRSKGLC